MKVLYRPWSLLQPRPPGLMAQLPGIRTGTLLGRLQFRVRNATSLCCLCVVCALVAESRPRCQQVSWKVPLRQRSRTTTNSRDMLESGCGILWKRQGTRKSTRQHGSKNNDCWPFSLRRVCVEAFIFAQVPTGVCRGLQAPKYDRRTHVVRSLRRLYCNYLDFYSLS
jgi:hypothetical protein